MTVAAVSATGLVKRYGDIEAVRGIDLSIEAGETFGFLGPNGAGKSTTISMLCTLVTPSGGNATVAGFDVVTQRDDVRRNIGLVFQDTTLDGYLTAMRNLKLHAELYDVPRAALDARLCQVLDMVPPGCPPDVAAPGTLSSSGRRSSTRQAWSTNTS